MGTRSDWVLRSVIDVLGNLEWNMKLILFGDRVNYIFILEAETRSVLK